MSTRDRILIFIRDYISENSWAPSYREMCEGVGIGSTSTMKFHIEKLDYEGLIRFGNGPRKIAITESGMARIDELEKANGDF